MAPVLRPCSGPCCQCEKQASGKGSFAASIPDSSNKTHLFLRWRSIRLTVDARLQFVQGLQIHAVWPESNLRVMQWCTPLNLNITQLHYY